MTKRVKKILCITIPLGTLFLICIIGFCVLLYLSLYGNGFFAKTTKDINRYGEFRENHCLVEKQYVFFPQTLDNVEKVNEYLYVYDTFAGGGHQIYLDVSYSALTFQSEMERWKNYKDSWYSQSPKFDDAVLFNNPTLVFWYWPKHYYGYISFIEEEYRVIYVLIEVGDADILIPESYMPKNYWKNENGGGDGYLYIIESKSNRWYE